MKWEKWEYRTDRLIDGFSNITESDIRELLEERGREGWELAAQIYKLGGINTLAHYEFIFKRPIKGTSVETPA